MRFHLFGLASLPTSKANFHDVFTQLIWNMGKMLKDHNHHVIFYGVEGSDVPCDEFVSIVPKDLVVKRDKVLIGIGPNYPDSPTWQAFKDQGRVELRKRYRTGDISLISFGNYQCFVAEESELSCEFICGYSGIFSGHKVFPSQAWMYYLYGELKMADSPCWLDAVIPHYINLDDFPYQEQKGDYLLFMGRLAAIKGPDIAIQLAKASGNRIIVAGLDPTTCDIPDWLGGPQDADKKENVEFVGHVGPRQRLELMQNERRPEVFNVTNATGKAKWLKFKITGLKGGANPPYIKAYQVEYIDTRQGSILATALVPLQQQGGFYVSLVPAGMTRQIWLSADWPKIKAGDYDGTIELKCGGDKK